MVCFPPVFGMFVDPSLVPVEYISVNGRHLSAA